MSTEREPLFLEPVTNETVAVGRDASLSCVVEHLGEHRVSVRSVERESEEHLNFCRFLIVRKIGHGM